MKDSWQKYAVAANKQDQTGLCSTCNQQATCCYMKRASRPILECEEFDAYAPERSRPVMPDRAAAVVAADADSFKGLCVNCDFRRDCANAGCEGGVWHCEEYR